jgi:2-polyprenyl-3-methyl-5-hydroxy-6-metoxy-1,4-benzoquinol methylase
MDKGNTRPGTLLRWHVLKRILRSEVKNNSVILDLGGYDGFVVYNLKKNIPNLNVIVVDINESGLQVAKERGVNILNASALELPITDNRADVILCLDLIEHVKEDSKLLKEITRVLKTGGKIILTTPMQNGISFPLLNKDKIAMVKEGWGHIRNGYSLKDLESLFKDAGLIIDNTSIYFNLFTRLVYCLSFLTQRSLKGKGMLYRLIIRLEPYIKFGAEEYIIVGKKVRA